MSTGSRVGDSTGNRQGISGSASRSGSRPANTASTSRQRTPTGSVSRQQSSTGSFGNYQRGANTSRYSQRGMSSRSGMSGSSRGMSSRSRRR
jgi:hypothetical protein